MTSPSKPIVVLLLVLLNGLLLVLHAVMRLVLRAIKTIVTREVMRATGLTREQAIRWIEAGHDFDEAGD